MSGKNDVRIDVVGDVGGFASATAQAEKELDGLKQSAEAAGGGLRGSSAASGLMEGATIALTGVVATAAAGMAAWATAQLAASLAIKDTADQIDKLSQRMGESTESVSELRYAFELNDASMEEMATLMKSLANKAQDAARGAGQASAAYKAMGISVVDTNGAMKTSRELLEEVADRIASYKDGAAKAALVQDALGGQWVKMIPLLNQGAQGLRDAAAEAHKLGVVFDTELTKQADALNDDLTRLKAAAEGVKISLGRDLIPSLADTAAEMVKLKIEGHGVLAMLRGIAGIGKIPFDLILGSSKPDLSVGTQLKEMKAELAGLEANLKSPANEGLLGRMVFGKKDDMAQRIAVLKNQIGVIEKYGERLEFKKGTDEEKPDAPVPVKPPKPARSGGGRSAVDQGARLIAQLDEQIALKNADAASTEKQSAAEQQRTRVIFEMDAGTLKVTKSQRALIEGRLDDIVTLEAQIKAQREFTAGVERQEAANVKARQSMIEQIATAERETELYGLTAAQISVVEQARLADAIALATEKGATEAQLAPLREELALRGQLSEALSRKEAHVYDLADAKKSVDGEGKEMGEFAKQAAKNMQDAMAEFFIDPTKKGMQSIAETFGQTIQKMIAQAAAAQLGKLLFGDMDKTGELGGLVGAIPWGSIISAFGFHEGGVVGAGGQSFTRAVPAGVFANAPRFHGGGLAGDEVPAILQKGERVLTKEQQKSGRDSEGQRPIVVNVNSSTGDPAEIRRSAAAGARTALGFMSGSRRYA